MAWTGFVWTGGSRLLGWRAAGGSQVAFGQGLRAPCFCSLV